MMGIIFSVAVEDGKSRKRRQRILVWYSVFCLTLLFTINSMIHSVINSAKDIMYQPYGRVAAISVDRAAYEEAAEKIKDILKGEKGIGQFYFHLGAVDAVWENADITGFPYAGVHISTYINALDEYLTAGAGDVKKGEIVIPQYLYDMGGNNSYTYTDGRQLLGEEIKLEVNNTYMNENKQYIFTVKGVYDNVRAMSGNNMFCVSEEDARELYDFCRCYGEEEYIKSVMEMYDITQEECEDIKAHYYMGIYVNKDYDLENMADIIEEKTGESPFLYMDYDHDEIHYMELILYICNLMIGMLMITMVIAFVIMQHKDIKSRKRIMAQKYAFGYTTEMQIGALIIEKMMLLARIFVWSIVFSGIFIFIGNVVIQEIMDFYMRSFSIRMDTEVVFIGIGIVCVLVISIILVIFGNMRKVKLAELLRQEA